MRKSLLLSTAAFAAIGLASSAAYATDDSTPETIVVTATRTPTPEEQVASSITVITADEIAAQQLRTLPDILKEVPGLNLVQTGGPGAQTSVFMRGTNSNHTKVLVDGIDVSDPSSAAASFDFGQFLTQDIDRVEVLRGPQSGLYGSDAIGGVINIITKSGNGPLQARADVEGGSFDTFNQSAGVSGSTDAFHYSVNLEHLHAGDTPVTPIDLLKAGEKRNDDYYDNVTASTKLGYDITNNFDLGVVGRYTNTTLKDTGEDFSTFPAFPDANRSLSDTIQYYGRATAHLVSFDGILDQTFGVAYTSDRSLSFSPDFGGSTSLNAGNRTKLDWQGNIKISSGELLVLGAEHADDEISLPISAHTIINSGYGELQSTFTDNFFNTLSLRYDDNSRFGGVVTYRVAPAYVISETGTKLKASIGTGFKAPTLSELFQNFPPFFFGNPNLKPETDTGYDAGFEQALLGDKVGFGATYFYNNIRNLITTDTTGTTYANIDRAKTDGVESFVSYRPIDSLILRADYTYTQAYDAITHLELLRRPKHKVTLDANWQATTALSFDATLLSVSSWIDGNRDFSIPRLRAPGYTTLNIAANYDLTDQFTLYGRVDNLTDEHYENPVGFLQPSIGFFAGVKAKI
jgi:vitamin B12 transporter